MASGITKPRFEVDYLNREDLIFELKCRGLEGFATVDEMRKSLRQLLRVEAEGKGFEVGELKLDIDQEFEICTAKLKEIAQLLTEFSGTRNSRAHKKLDTKLMTVFNRLNKIKPTDPAQQNKKAEMLKLAIDYLGTVGQKCGDEQTSSPAERESSSRTADEEEMPEPTTPVTQLIVRKTQIPVKDWGLKFSGDGKGLSISAFLDELDLMRRGRNTPPEDLFAAAYDLFTGAALTWYRAIRREVTDWSSLVEELKAEFEPYDYEERLMEEIRQRLQGPEEPIGVYVAVMKNYFYRLKTPLTEPVKLKIIMRNLQPQLLEKLCCMDVGDIDEVLRRGRQIEAANLRIQEQRNVPRIRKSVLEPDLAYEPRRTKEEGRKFYRTSAVKETTIQAEKESANQTQTANPPRGSRPRYCWNCGNPGHLFRNCRTQRTKFCTTCGKRDSTKDDCPRCFNRQQGNGKGGTA